MLDFNLFLIFKDNLNKLLLSYLHVLALMVLKFEDCTWVMWDGRWADFPPGHSDVLPVCIPGLYTDLKMTEGSSTQLSFIVQHQKQCVAITNNTYASSFFCPCLKINHFCSNKIRLLFCFICVRKMKSIEDKEFER